MKKILSKLVVIVLMTITLTGCETNMSYTFNVETEEQIKVQLNTTDGEKLFQENGTFTVKSKDDEETSIGIFFLPDVFQDLYSNVDELDGVEIISTNEDSDPNYIFYKVVGDTTTEWNYLIKPSDSQAGIVLSNITSEESAKALFELLTFEVNPD